MSFTTRSLGGLLTVAAVTVAAIVLGGTPVQAQPELWVRVSDTTAVPGQKNTVISIYMNNYQDTVSGFNLLIQLDQPDIMEFQTDSGTVIDTTCWKCLEWSGPICVDSEQVPIDTNTGMCDSTADWPNIDTLDVLIGNVDTVGTLIGGWPLVDARSLSGSGFDLNIAGLAFTENDTDLVGFAPQQGGLLVKVLADVFNIPDTMQDRTVDLRIQSATLDHFNFSRPDGSSIGIVYDTVPDTNCWICTVWIIPGSLCGDWERVSSPPGNDYGNCDSLDIQMVEWPQVDTTTVTLLDGSVTVLGFVCGDADGVDGEVNVGDLSYMVSYLFLGGPAPDPPGRGNVDCVGTEPDVGDLSWLVSYLFLEGPAPCECK